jgi:hypothetical protein
MLKKLFITAAAAAAVSVPLAGVAWADPSQPNNPPGHNPTGPGVPHGVGATLDAVSAANPALPSLNPNGTGNPVSPGQAFNQAKDQFGGPGVSTPKAVGAFVDKEFNNYLGIPGTDFGTTGLAPGLATKTFTPGCKSGHTAASGPVGPGVCN